MRLASSWLISVCLASAVALVGCDVGGGAPSGGGGDPGGPGDLRGTLAGGTQSGSLHLAEDATIPAGTTVTFAAGSSFAGAAGKHLTVQGTLVVDGTADATVSMVADDDGDPWGGIIVASGGSATIHYATGTGVDELMDCQAGATTCALDHLDFTDVGGVVKAASIATLAASRVNGMENGAVTVTRGGSLTVSDTELMQSSHDLVTASGGALRVEYSAIGGTTGTFEHCNFHIGSADSLVITHTNIVTGVYGMMIGDVASPSITYNNWEGNTTDVSPVGDPTGADFTHNYWAKGAPGSLGPEYDFSSAETGPVADAGPRT
jgi:hypothetical protein